MTEDQNLKAVTDLVRRVNEAETAIDRITQAWEAMSFADRILVDDISHQLADAIVRGTAQAFRASE